MPNMLSGDERCGCDNDVHCGRCPKVLVVDDVQDNLDLIVQLFEGESWNIRTVDNAKDGWTAVRRWHPDVVVLDIRMPEFNGHHLCTAIRMKHELDDIPVIFLTCEYTSKPDIERGMKMGAADYICRPVDGQVLRRRVREVIQQHRSRHVATGAGA